jgi:hypothetical protein
MTRSPSRPMVHADAAPIHPARAGGPIREDDATWPRGLRVDAPGSAPVA